jgi:hypothetical protein
MSLQIAQERAKTTGRNDPCPCGSGKKYKKCHEAEDSAAVNAELARSADVAAAEAAAAAKEAAEGDGEAKKAGSRSKLGRVRDQGQTQRGVGRGGQPKATNLPRRSAV